MKCISKCYKIECKTWMIMEDLFFEQLKISALRKLRHIQGPNQQKETHRPKNVVNGQQSKDNTDSFNNGDSSKAVPVRYMLKELELQRQTETQNAIHARLQKFKNFTGDCLEKNDQEWLKKQQDFVSNQLCKENDIMNKLSNYDKIISRKKKESDEAYRQMQQQQRQLKEDELNAKRMLKQNVDKVGSLYKEFSKSHQEILKTIKSCLSPPELTKLCSEELRQITSIKELFDETLKLCKSHSINQEHVVKLTKKYEELNAYKQKVITTANNVNVKVTESRKPPPPPPVEKPATPTPVVQPKIEVATPPPPVVTKPPEVVSNIIQYVSQRNLEMYKEVMNFAEQHTNSIKTLVDDATYKQFKFDCKKAINIPVNAISDVNSSHLMDKYNKLHNLLSGKTVMVSNQQINASKHPNGIAFCMDLLAKKFVLQGDLMISSKPEAAFCYASIINSLWNDFPVLGKLILAYLFKSCPYLVPYYIPQKDGETDEEFYQRRGYQYINGQIEKQDKFLKRMTGIMRLYAALMITPPKRSQNKIPHNLSHGYRWLASMLKLEPDVDISATMMYDFLEVVGYSMNKAYKRQFTKLINIVIKDFVPKSSKNCTGGAGTRLELLLTDYLKTGQMEKPNGFSEIPFW